MQDLLLTIPLPNEDFFKSNLTAVKKLKKEINKKWADCDKDLINYEDVEEFVEKAEESFSSYLSVYSLVPLLDKTIKREETQSFDVTRIVISEKTYDFLKNLDFKLVKAMHGDRYTDSKIKSQVSMFHFSSGFATRPELDDDKIYVLQNPLKEKRD